MLDELDPIVGEHRVDLVGNGPEQGRQEAGCDQLGRLPVDPGEDQFGGAVHGHEQMGFAALVAQFCDVDMEIANLIGFEPLGLLAIRLRQAGDAVTLKAAM